MSHLAESPATDPSSLEFGEGFRVVHRTIVRPDMELDVTALYVGGGSGSGGGAGFGSGFGAGGAGGGSGGCG